MKRPCICIAAGFALGEALAYAVMGRYLMPAVALAAIALVFCVILLKTDKRQALIMLGLFFILGVARLSLDGYTHKQYDKLESLCTGSEESYTAEVTAITVKGERLNLRCGELMVYYTPAWDKSRTGYGDATSFTEGELARMFSIGNRIRITGDFEIMDEPRNPGEFNYYTYYLADGITHRCFADSIEVVNPRVNKIPDAIFRIRRDLLRRIDAIYDDDDSGVLRAVLLGDKSTLSDDISDIYRKNGIAHLLAISGLHVGIIGMSLYSFLRKKLKLSYWVCGIVCGLWTLFYCLLTGAGVSTVRATLMLLIMFLGEIMGMNYDMLSSCGLAALIILIIHPYQLLNCAFLLSFACIIAIAGPATYITRELHVKNIILKALILSVTIQLFTLPITAYFFFEVSPYGCLLNLIVIPLMTYVVWTSIISVILTFIWPTAALVVSSISHYILTFYTWLGSITLKLPGSTILIGRPALWQICVYYFLFFCVLYSYRLKDPIHRSLSSMSVRGTASASAQEEKTSS